MKIIFILGALFLTLSLNVFAQEDGQPTPQSTPQKTADRTSSVYTRPDAKTRRNDYFKSMFGPYAVARTVVGAGFGTWRNSPEEWGGKWEGFGRRVASGFGKTAIKQTTIYALDESFKLDSKFYRSQRRTFGAKVKNALVSPFTARTPSGKRVFGFPRIVGTYTSSIVAAEAWYPRRYDYRDGLRSGTISLGFNAAFNLFKEFIKK
jgi:hypothetical protein